MASFISHVGKLYSGKRRGPTPWSAVLVSVAAHILFFLGAAYLTVLVIQGRQKVMFEAKKPPSIPARKLEHSIRVKQMQEQVRKPQILQRLVSQSPTAVALPELPKMDMPNLKNMRDTPMLQAKAGSDLGALGAMGGGAGRGLTGGTGFSDTKFFGQNVRTRAIVLLLDASQTLINKNVLGDVVRETGTMLEGLTPATQFNVIGFVDGAAAMFPQMVFATRENKAAALARLKTRSGGLSGSATLWTEEGFVPNRVGNLAGYSGSTPWKAIELAVEMGADTVFIVMDDEPPYVRLGTINDPPIETHKDDILNYARKIETQTGRPVRISVVMYRPRETQRGKDAVAFYKDLCRITGGRLSFFGEK
jgi:hypothetical protein